MHLPSVSQRAPKPKGLHALRWRRFARRSIFNCCRPTGGSPAKPEPWNGHRTKPAASLLAPSQNHGFQNYWRGGAGAPQLRRPPLLLTLSPAAFVSEGANGSLGWQQYSCQLWLSRVNPYILYPKAINCDDACFSDPFSTDEGHSLAKPKLQNQLRCDAWHL